MIRFYVEDEMLSAIKHTLFDFVEWLKPEDVRCRINRAGNNKVTDSNDLLKLNTIFLDAAKVSIVADVCSGIYRSVMHFVCNPS